MFIFIRMLQFLTNKALCDIKYNGEAGSAHSSACLISKTTEHIWMKSGESTSKSSYGFNFGFHESNINPDLHSNQIKMHQFSQTWLNKKQN
jgi:hypothetical protein